MATQCYAIDEIAVALVPPLMLVSSTDIDFCFKNRTYFLFYFLVALRIDAHSWGVEGGGGGGSFSLLSIRPRGFFSHSFPCFSLCIFFSFFLIGTGLGQCG
jgi:hypothetical protein